MHSYQATIRSEVSLSGIGVHSGKPVSIHLIPADADAGVVFHVLSGGRTYELPALHSRVGATELCTVLGDPAGVHVATVEHIMAALAGLGIDNLTVEIDALEMPVFDGSSAAIVEAVDGVGIAVQKQRRRMIRVLKPVRVESGPSFAEFRPYAGTRYEVEIDFESPAIGHQAYIAELTPDLFRRELARARTFGFIKDVERLWACGHALGASLENAVVIGEDGRVVNAEGLRFKDEFVRHKLLDAVGDLALAGMPFIGCFRSYRGGHRMNAAALGALLADRSAYEIVEASGGRKPARAPALSAAA